MAKTQVLARLLGDGIFYDLRMDAQRSPGCENWRDFVKYLQGNLDRLVTNGGRSAELLRQEFGSRPDEDSWAVLNGIDWVEIADEFYDESQLSNHPGHHPVEAALLGATGTMQSFIDREDLAASLVLGRLRGDPDESSAGERVERSMRDLYEEQGIAAGNLCKDFGVGDETGFTELAAEVEWQELGSYYLRNFCL